MDEANAFRSTQGIYNVFSIDYFKRYTCEYILAYHLCSYPWGGVFVMKIIKQ